MNTMSAAPQAMQPPVCPSPADFHARSAHSSDAVPCPLLQAPLMVERSVQGILTVMANLSQDTSGAFLDWEGNTLPW